MLQEEPKKKKAKTETKKPAKKAEKKETKKKKPAKKGLFTISVRQSNS